MESIFNLAKTNMGAGDRDSLQSSKGARERRGRRRGERRRGEDWHLRASGVGSLDLDGWPTELRLQAEGGDVRGFIGSLTK